MNELKRFGNHGQIDVFILVVVEPILVAKF